MSAVKELRNRMGLLAQSTMACASVRGLMRNRTDGLMRRLHRFPHLAASLWLSLPASLLGHWYMRGAPLRLVGVLERHGISRTREKFRDLQQGGGLSFRTEVEGRATTLPPTTTNK